MTSPLDKVNEQDPVLSRRAFDPLEIEFGDKNLRRQALNLDIEALNTSLDPNERIELLVDACYLMFRDEELVERATGLARSTMDMVVERLDVALTPTERLRMRMRLLDLGELHSLGLIRQTELDHYDGDSLEEFDAKHTKAMVARESRLVLSVRAGIDMLEEAHKAHEASEAEPVLQRDLRGMMFEALVMTYARYLLYEDENTLDGVFGSSYFSDKSSAHDATTKNHDMVVRDIDGNPISIIQTKNYHMGHNHYDRRIDPVEAHNFGLFMREPGKYIHALRLLIDNNPMTSEKMLVEAKARLEEITGLRALLEARRQSRRVASGIGMAVEAADVRL
ncbi:hypothetical protein KC878_01060 [Candidatus Saccharibacteria bacterium]|nr:hypothetical protein [Candidatus Saccharibacteria bacterium]MCB9821153.1 hypothetical protein [Candidatus Nomurabacteria bacterium]